MNERKYYAKRVLDYEIGHLIKSPCKGCPVRYQFPRCMSACAILDRIQTRLAQSISTTKVLAPWESHQVLLEQPKDK
ncbi:MAG: hypothetical protein M0036_27135 [Desulfobacteraceae bacterium]|nr:hypothetical protein [Desulfobacteraceae bacterium]